MCSFFTGWVYSRSLPRLQIAIFAIDLWSRLFLPCYFSPRVAFTISTKNATSLLIPVFYILLFSVMLQFYRIISLLSIFFIFYNNYYPAGKYSAIVFLYTRNSVIINNIIKLYGLCQQMCCVRFEFQCNYYYRYIFTINFL